MFSREIIDDSWRYYRELLASENAVAAGICELSGYFFTKDGPEKVSNAHLARLCADYRPATERELRLCPGGWTNGVFCTTLLADDTYHLGWLTERFKEAGGTIIEAEVRDLRELAGYDIVANCSGLGAKRLLNDRRLVPLRGQVYKVKAPWIKTFLYCGEDTYVIPGVDHVTLGGSRRFAATSLDIDKYESKAIWERCTRYVPSLRRAQIVEEWVGLRPHRDPVRIEKERLDTGLTVVHCYGHGGYGVMTAPGSAALVSRLVTEVTSGDFTNPAISSL
ncbi:D-aspartate oxidase-like [Amphibalanus amphitrite]|uniref:D-aspartate oxidase-like n=1 Tax=Amphibalanus amphitrite TaxID=1232801 RepID=UPI001C8FF1A4|nr:D-aspartate oxidase-like [Amphibalanus amphitrite]